MSFDNIDCNTSTVAGPLAITNAATGTVTTGAVAAQQLAVTTLTAPQMAVTAAVTIAALTATTAALSSAAIGSQTSTAVSTTGNVSITTIPSTTLTADNATIQTLICQTLDAPANSAFNSITAGTLNATAVNTAALSSTNINCTTLSTNTLIAGTVSSSVFNSTNTTTLNYTATTPLGAPANAQVQTSTFVNGQLSTQANYNVINNTVSTFSDLQLLNGPTGFNKFYIYGYEQSSTVSLPIITTVNNQLSAFDNQNGFGNTYMVMSLTNNAGATLRYEQTGNLTLYANPTTITWQTSLLVSDIREKTNIRLLDADTAFLLDPVYFHYKTGGPRRAGFIAQDVERVMPECILKPDVDGAHLSMRYEKIIPFLIESLKTL